MSVSAGGARDEQEGRERAEGRQGGDPGAGVREHRVDERGEGEGEALTELQKKKEEQGLTTNTKETAVSK